MQGFVTAVQNLDNGYSLTVFVSKPVNNAKEGSKEYDKLEQTGKDFMRQVSTGNIELEYK